MIKQKIEKFTDSQDVGLEKIEAFLKKPVDNTLASRVFVLEGKAGTGKTTIIKYALKKELEWDLQNVNKNDMNFDMFTTPKVIGVTQSHKAKNVLSNSIHVCKTFASTFGLNQTYNEDGSIDFEKPKFKNPNITLACEQSVKVFVHDECSMYDKKMLDYVLKESNFSSKIIFMGDAGQLPPVKCFGDEDSPVFTLNLPPENKHLLTERVRQTNNNPIIPLSDIIYEEIFGSQNLQRVINEMNKINIIDGKGIDHVSRANFLQHFKAISKDYTDTKVVAYRRKTVDDFNNYIRKYIHNNPDKEFIPGEIIYMTDTYINEVKGNKYSCFNSDEYIIKSIGVSKPRLTYNEEKIETDAIYVSTKGHPHLFDFNDVNIPVVNKNSIKVYTKEISKLSYLANSEKNSQAKKFKWKNFYEFKKQWGSISYGYCYTGHKIQGSGYKNIYVDVNDILTVSMISNKRKLQSLYTAITRATDLVILIKK